MLHDLCAPLLSRGLLTVNCGILHSSDVNDAVKELTLVKIQYKQLKLKERPAEGHVKCVPRVGLSSVLSSFQTLSSSVLPEALLLLAPPALSVATSTILFDGVVQYWCAM